MSIPRRFRLRPLRPEDDAAMAAVIRRVMPEFGATGAGFAINDPEVDWLHRAYSMPRSAYYVIDIDGVGADNGLVGGGGIAPLTGGDAVTCELRKMYFLPEARGLGAGAALMAQCLQAARGFGFERCYVETLSGMEAAQRLYQRSGFRRIDAPLGATGHGGCNTFYLRDLL